MNKKIISALAITLLTSNAFTMVVSATPDTNTSVDINNKVKTTDKDDFLNRHPELQDINKNDMKPISYSAEFMVVLEKCLSLIDEAEKTGDIKTLQEAYTTFFNYYPSLDNEDIIKHKDFDQVDYIFMKGAYIFVYNTENNQDLRDEFMIKFSDDIFLATVKRFNEFKQLMFLQEYLYYFSNNYESDNARAKKIVSVACAQMKYMENYVTPPGEDDFDPEDGRLDENKTPSYIVDNEEITEMPDENPDNPEKPDIEDPDKNPNDDLDEEDEAIKNQIKSEDIDYIAKNNKCYKVTTKYIDGEQVGVDKELLPASQNSFCNIYSTEIINGDEWNKNHNGNFALGIWNSIAQNELNQYSNRTIQYTLDKTEEKPYYYDSGIRVSVKDTATFTQLTSVLTQLAVKTDGYLIEDEGKILFIAEGKPLVIVDKKDEYSKEEIENLLNSFSKLGFKIDERKTTDGTSIEDSLEAGKLNKITVGEEELELKNSPLVEDGFILLPVKQVAEKLGYTYSESKEKVTLTMKDDNRDILIEYTPNTKIVNVNGVEKKMTSNSKYSNDVFFAEMNLVAKELDMKISYDSDRGTIEIK